MLVQPSRTATECEVDLVRKTTRLCDRAQTLDTEKPAGVTHARLTLRLTRASPCEDCSAFTRVAARTLAPSPIRDQLHRRLQPFCYLHDCSGCFRLERLPGGAAPTGKRRLVTAHTSSGHCESRQSGAVAAWGPRAQRQETWNRARRPSSRRHRTD